LVVLILQPCFKRMDQAFIQTFNLNLYSHVFRAIVNSSNTSHNEKLGVFTVLGTIVNPNVIRLFPKESYSCSSQEDATI